MYARTSLSSSSGDRDATRATTTNATNLHSVDEPLERGYPSTLYAAALRKDGDRGTNGNGSDVCVSGQDFKRQLRDQIAVAQNGNRGLEAALQLICERVLDVQDCWDRVREEQKSTEAKYYKLREECLERQQQLLDLNSDMREDLSKLQASVQEQLIPATSGGEGTPEDLVAPDKNGGIAASVDFTEEANNAEHSSNMDEKDEIADNSQGGNGDGVEPGIHERAPGQEDQPCSTYQNDPKEKRHPALVVSKEQQPSGGDMNITSNFPAGALSETMKDDRATPLRRAEARKRWEKVMMKSSTNPSETIVARVGRLEKAMGVSGDPDGGGRLDRLARDVRLSLAMVFEHQARAASDNLSASLSLFPAETEDTSLLSVALPGPPTLGGSCRRNDVQKRQLSSSVETHTHGGGSGSGGVGAGSGGSGRGGGGIGGNVERGDGTESKGGDVGRLWMAEDGGYLCVDLLLERTLDELTEGLHFAMSHAEHATGGSAPGLSTFATAAVDAGNASRNTPPRQTCDTRTQLKKEMGRMQDRCVRLRALVARVEHKQGDGDHGDRGEYIEHSSVFAVKESNRTATSAAKTSEILRLSCALAGDLQYLLSQPDYCPFLDAFSFTPTRKCLCGRDFHMPTKCRPPAAGEEIESPGASSTRSLHHLASQGPPLTRKTDGGGAGGLIAGRKPGTSRPLQPCRQSVVMAIDVGAGAKTPVVLAPPSVASTGNTDDDGDGAKAIDGNGSVAWYSREQDGENGGNQGLRVRPTLYHCLVLSLAHLSSFIGTARACVVHRAAASLGEGVAAAEGGARDAMAAAWSAQSVARQASSEALSAITRATSAAVSARNEGSVLLEELHEQLAKAMQTERGRMEKDRDERERAERERVSHLLETQLGHLKSLLDSKAGRDDLVSVARAMGDVEQTLAVVRESVPGGHALHELQEALSRKADKSYTKRKMAILVTRVSALLKDDADEPTLAKQKCLSCDRAFNKTSFRDLEMAYRLPDASTTDDPQLKGRAGHSGDPARGTAESLDQQTVVPDIENLVGEDTDPLSRRAASGWGGGYHPQYTARASGGWSGGAGGAPPGRSGTRPGSAPSARPRAELAPHGANKRLDRPSSARLGPSHRWNSGTPPGAGGGGFRQGGGGGRGRPKTRAPNLPPSQQASLPVPPAALSATMGSLTEGARKALGAEMARTERVAAAVEPTPTPDHLRYGGMTATPLVRQLFANIGGKAIRSDKAWKEGGKGRMVADRGCGGGGGGSGRGGGGGGGPSGSGKSGGDKIAGGGEGSSTERVTHDDAAPSPWENLAGEMQDGQKSKEGPSSLPGTRGTRQRTNNSLPSTFVPKAGRDGRGGGGRRKIGSDRRDDQKHEDRFASALEHHKRNVVAVTVDP